MNSDGVKRTLLRMALRWDRKLAHRHTEVDTRTYGRMSY